VLTRDVGDGNPQPVSFDEMIAELFLLGHAEPSDDEERQFAEDVRVANPDWEPGSIPRLPTEIQLREFVRDAAPLYPRSTRRVPVVRTQVGRAPRSRRSRATARARSPGSDDDDSEEPDLAPNVTDSPAARPCEICGRDFTPRRRSNARLCSSACKQRAYRRRRKLSVTRERPRLTFEERRILGELVRQRKLAKLAADDRRLNARIRAQFGREAA
jgi:hypothetical protein